VDCYRRTCSAHDVVRWAGSSRSGQRSDSSAPSSTDTHTQIHTYIQWMQRDVALIASQKRCGKTEEIEKHQSHHGGSAHSIRPGMYWIRRVVNHPTPKFRNCKAGVNIVCIRSALFWNNKQRGVVITHRRFGTTYRSHPQGVKKSKMDFLTPWRSVCITELLCPSDSISDEPPKTALTLRRTIAQE